MCIFWIECIEPNRRTTMFRKAGCATPPMDAGPLRDRVRCARRVPAELDDRQTARGFFKGGPRRAGGLRRSARDAHAARLRRARPAVSTLFTPFCCMAASTWRATTRLIAVALTLS